MTPKILHALGIMSALTLPVACGDDDVGQQISGVWRIGPTYTEDSGAEEVEDECAALKPGAICDEDKHCVDRRCVFNSCGDGFVAGSEECDDGNAARGDGCSPSCVKERAP